jgi:hypothetical protein
MYQFVSLSILQYMPLCPRKLCQTQHGCQGKSFKPESLFLGDQRAHNRKTKSPWFVKGLDEECATIWCADLGNAFENDWSAIVFHLPIDKTTHSLKSPPTILLCLWSETENGIVIKSHVISTHTSTRSNNEGLALPVRTVLKFDLVASNVFSILSIYHLKPRAY